MCLCDVFQEPIINSLVRWFCIGILGLVPFQTATFYTIKCWLLVKEGFLAAQRCVCSVVLLPSTASVFQSSVNHATLHRYHSSCCALTNLKFLGGRFFATVGKGLWCILLSLLKFAHQLWSDLFEDKFHLSFDLHTSCEVTCLKTRVFFWSAQIWAVSVNSITGKCLLLNF